MIKRSLLAAGLTSGLLAAPLAAASPQLAVTVPSAMPLAAVGISEAACKPAPALPVVAVQQSAHPLLTNFTSARVAKSAAIMGGQMSSLERMRLEQSGQAAPAAMAPAAAPALAPQVLAACATLSAVDTANRALAVDMRQPVRAITPAAGRFLGTERIRIGRTRFDASWERVSAGELSRRDVRRAIGKLPQGRDALLSQVNRWVNQKIEYRDDRVQFGQNDYWADARLTLSTRSGDCEDYAILKMQMLAAAGVAREDMMLTLARDTIQRTDHAVLLVRHEGEWVMLDMASDRVAPASMDYGYKPVMSFAANERFIHGTPVNQRPQQRIRVAYAN